MKLTDILVSLKPIRVEECLGAHRPRSLARVGVVNMSRQALSIIFQLVLTVVLSRLLPPSTFGLLAMATFFSGFLSMLSSSGIVQSTVQKKSLNINELNGVFWLNNAISVSLALLFVGSAPLIANFYNEPELVSICIVLGLLFFFQNIFSAHQALIERTMSAEISLFIFIFQEATRFSISVILALNGFGVWSLVGASISSTITSILLYLYFVRWCPGRFSLSRDYFGMIRYGLGLTSASIVNYLSSYSQNLVLGKFASPADVGLYNRGHTFSMMPMMAISWPIAQMVMPTFSALQDNKEDLLKLLLRATWVVVIITVPFVLFLIAFGDIFIVLLLSDTWTVSGEVARWLALGSIPVLLTNLIGRGNNAIGRPGRGVPIALAGLPILLFGFLKASPNGAVEVAKFYAVYRFCHYPIALWYHLKGSGFDSWSYVSSQVKLWLITLCVGILLMCARELAIKPLDWSYVVILSIALSFAYICFLVGYRCFSMGRDVLGWIYENFGSRLKLPRIIFSN